MRSSLRSAGVVMGATLLAGTLDIADATVFSGLRGIAPGRVFQYIASGVLGRAAFNGSLANEVLGALLHYLIAFTATIAFCVAARKMAPLRRWPIAAGLLYGVAIYCAMNWVVLPLSNVPKPLPKASLAALVNGVAAVVLLVGLPISLIVHRYDTAE
jgi:hypothetical protein